MGQAGNILLFKGNGCWESDFSFIVVIFVCLCVCLCPTCMNVVNMNDLKGYKMCQISQCRSHR